MIERANRGFTLMEVMITVVIVGILTAIAYPSYTQQVIKSRRTDAQQALTDLANRQERNYLNSGGGTPTYTTTLVPTTLIPGLGYATTLTPDGMYNLSAAAGACGTIASCFKLSAAPVAGKPQANDAACATLTLDSTGKKDATGTKPTTCW